MQKPILLLFISSFLTTLFLLPAARNKENSLYAYPYYRDTDNPLYPYYGAVDKAYEDTRTLPRYDGQTGLPKNYDQDCAIKMEFLTEKDSTISNLLRGLEYSDMSTKSKTSLFCLAAKQGKSIHPKETGFPLQIAAECHGQEKAFVDYIIASKANINAQDEYGRTALMSTNITEAGVAALLAHNPDLTLRDEQKNTVLRYALLNGRAMVEQLAAAGYNFLMPLGTGEYPVHLSYEKFPRHSKESKEVIEQATAKQLVAKQAQGIDSTLEKRLEAFPALEAGLQPIQKPPVMLKYRGKLTLHPKLYAPDPYYPQEDIARIITYEYYDSHMPGDAE